MEENEKIPQGNAPDTEEKAQQKEPLVKGIKEEFYDKIPISVKTLDKIIVVLFILIFLCIIIGRNVHY